MMQPQDSVAGGSGTSRLNSRPTASGFMELEMDKHSNFQQFKTAFETTEFKSVLKSALLGICSGSGQSNPNPGGIVEVDLVDEHEGQFLEEESKDDNLNIDLDFCDIDHTSCDRLGYSYCLHQDTAVCSGQTKLDMEVLNMKWRCVSRNYIVSEVPEVNQVTTSLKSSTDSGNVRDVGNEELYQIDMNIEKFVSMIRWLEQISDRMESMTPEEFSASKIPKMDKDTLRAFSMEYGRHTTDVVTMLKRWPAHYIPKALAFLRSQKKNCEDHRHNLPNAKAERDKWLLLQLEKRKENDNLGNN